MTALTIRAPAKLNLTLRVVGRRPDGYHEIESLVAQIAFFDELAASPRDDVRWTIASAAPGLPLDESNLVWRALDALARNAGVRRGLDFVLRKRIPIGAGLGGGSSDAAATLVLANRAWGLGLDARRLAQIAASVGADVPLFLAGPLAAIRGRGERVEPVDVRLRGWAVLVLAPIVVLTREVYAGWRAGDDGAGGPGHATGARRPARDLFDGLRPATRRKVVHADALAPRLYNDLESPAMALHAELRSLFEAVRSVEPAVRMTGSGGALYCLRRDRASARALAGVLQTSLPEPVRVRCARLLGPGEILLPGGHDDRAANRSRTKNGA